MPITRHETRATVGTDPDLYEATLTGFAADVVVLAPSAAGLVHMVDHIYAHTAPAGGVGSSSDH